MILGKCCHSGATMDDILGMQNNFKSLSIKDLLEARDLYHYHLLNKKNVVGTAIGLYLIRHTDPTPGQEADRIKKERKEDLQQQRKTASAVAVEFPAAEPKPGSSLRKEPKIARTFANSGVRDYSWPCVIALVRQWVEESEFGTDPGSKLDPREMVPKTLYLPDGRMVPVCVVQVQQATPSDTLLPDWHWPSSRYSAGMPILVETQGQEHRATVGCLVSDGHTTYALTSRHVCGAAGEPVYTIADNKKVEIGYASKNHLTRKPFEEVYPEFPSHRTDVNLDVGLVELKDVNDWTSRTLGFGSTGALANLNALNITVRLIDAPVVAAGAASGRVEGRIKALFYRYKSIGGYDYVADFLIAPRDLGVEEEERRQLRYEKAAPVDENLPKQTQPGDSGAIWHLVTPRETETGPAGQSAPKGDEFDGELRPIAMEWGGQVFIDNGGESRFTFALATSLTTVSRLLDVELVLERDNGVLPYWGQTGHYSIASFAVNALPNNSLRTFISKNIERISFSIAGLSPKKISQKLKDAKKNDDLVPLADVPDMVWKKYVTNPGGRDDKVAGKGRTTGPEHPTHYADIDEKRPGDKKTLRDLCIKDPRNVNVKFWQDFYDACGHHDSRERGLLPFRVWQFFDAMKEFAENGDAVGFLCAAGLVSHYVGDACQPLHGSIYSDGYSDQPTTIVHHKRDTGEEYEEESHVGAGVHSTYESKMIDRHSEDIVNGLTGAVQPASVSTVPTTGQEAAVEIVRLMDRTAKAIEPKKLVATYIKAGSKPTVASQDALWGKFGQQTIDVMADGARVLAAVWLGAWTAGNGNAIAANKLRAVNADALIDRYNDRDFVPSLDLDSIAEVLGVAGAPVPGGNGTGALAPVG